jgi:hypothetical protein
MKTTTPMTCLKVLAMASLALVATVATPVAAQQIPLGSRVGDPPPSSGSYNSLGRRDPFVSLLTPRRAVAGAQPRIGTGLSSFFVADVVVTGITRIGRGETRMAILQSVDKQSYIAKVKDRLSDAVVKSIDATSVVFVEVPEPGAFGKPREIRKLLHSPDEVIR